MDEDKGKVLILGASGFLGKHLVKELRRLGYGNENLFYPKSSLETNLLYLNEMKYGIFDIKYDYIFLCTNWFRPGNFNVSADEFVNNNVINNNVLYYWKNQQPQATLITFGSDASYSEIIPHIEEYYLEGTPNPDYYSYGLTKRYMYQGVQEISKQTGSNYFHFVLLSIFGTDFKLDDEHLIHALVKKVVRAKYFNEEPVSLWGTGEQIREVTYVEDAVKNILQITLHPWDWLDSQHEEKREIQRIYNLGSDNKRLTVKEYMKMICDMVGYDFKNVVFDPTMQRGVSKKYLHNDKAKEFLNFKKDHPWFMDWTPCYGLDLYEYYDTNIRRSISNVINYYKNAIGV